jgi:hypothetical protein
MSLLRGKSSEMFLRLCSRAPRMVMNSFMEIEGRGACHGARERRGMPCALTVDDSQRKFGK